MSSFHNPLVVCLLCAVVSAGAAADQATARQRTQQLIIQFKSSGEVHIQSVRADQMLPDIALPDGRGLKFLRRFESRSAVVQLPESLSLSEAEHLAQQLEARPDIAAVVPNKRFSPALVPNDPQYLPGADAVNDPGQWHLFEDTAGINMQNGWDRSTGTAGVVIAVVDTGIIPHPDLNQARILPGYDFVSDTSADHDAVPGRDGDPTDPGDWAEPGDDCYANDSGKDRSSWHGLSIAGVIAAESDNARDIAGINFRAQVLPLRVLGTCGGLLSDVADAIRWAVGIEVAGVAQLNPNPARVINLSLSGDGPCSSVEQSAIDTAVSRGAVVVVSAGNEGGDVRNYSPANCRNVIVVGAIARDGRKAGYANAGDAVDVAAPGGDTPNPSDPLNPPNGILTLSNFGLTTAGDDALAVIQGTSFSAAQVSGVVSLMLAVNSALTPVLVEDLIKATARAFPDASCGPGRCGTGVVDAAAALAGAADPPAVLGSRVSTDSGAGSGGGGGGCALATTHASRFDPALFMLLLGLWWLARSPLRRSRS